MENELEQTIQRRVARLDADREGSASWRMVVRQLDRHPRSQPARRADHGRTRLLGSWRSRLIIVLSRQCNGSRTGVSDLERPQSI